MSALLEQQNLSDLNHLADGTWHVCFGTRSVDKTDTLGTNQIIVLPGVKFKSKDENGTPNLVSEQKTDKHSFISTVRSTVTRRHENGGFRKRSSN